MVYVRLARDWTDQVGALHGAGDLVDVDAITLAELEAAGTVGEPEGDSAWPGPTTPGDPEGDDAWPGPTNPVPSPGDPQKALR
jgi:hypothetical protein